MADTKRSGPHRRGLLMAVVGCLAAAGVLLTASGLDWLQASIQVEPPLPDVRKTFTGGEVVDALAGFGILVGAAGLALIATKRVGRMVVAAVLIVVGLLTLLAVGFFIYDAGREDAWSWAQDYATVGSSVFPDSELSPAPAVVALLGGLIAVVVGIFTAVTGRRWPVMGARYERRGPSAAVSPSSPPSSRNPASSVDRTPESQEAAMWSALERGEDPTAPAADPWVRRAPEPPDQPLSGR